MEIRPFWYNAASRRRLSVPCGARKEDDNNENVLVIPENTGNLANLQAVALTNRGLFTLVGVLDEGLGDLCLSFLLLALKRQQAPTLVLCSPGGAESCARAIIGGMEACKAAGLPVTTIGVGEVASAAFDIFIAGSKGRRFAHELSSYMTHATKNVEKEEMAIQEQLDRLTLAAYTTVNTRTSNKWLETGNYYMDAKTVMEYGAADHILYLNAPWPI